MTRINVIPARMLCDQHLKCELREILRIPTFLEDLYDRGKEPVVSKPDAKYVMGEGHVRFFYDKILYLKKRYAELLEETQARGFHATDEWPHHLIFPAWLNNDYEPDMDAILLNLTRLTHKFQYKFDPIYTARQK